MGQFSEPNSTGAPAADRIVREAERAEITGLRRTAWYEAEARAKRRNDDTFPKRIALGPAAVGWRMSALMKWIDAREAASEPKPARGRHAVR